MLRIDPKSKKLVRLEPRTMRDAGYWERRDIQEMICRSPSAFRDELGEYIHIVGAEVSPTDVVQDRVDLLGIDAAGASVIIEIKRDSHKLHLLQGLTYASMISKWETSKFADSLVAFNEQYRGSAQTVEDAQEELSEILEDGDVDAINRQQRVLLLAEHFDYEVLVTAEWLTEKYEVDIRCYRIGLAKDAENEFLTIAIAYPPPELADISVRRRLQKNSGAQVPVSWNDAFAAMGNGAMKAFFEAEVAGKVDGRPYRKLLIYRYANKIRFRVGAKKFFATVLQTGRFEGDVEYWSSRLSSNAEIRTRSKDRYVRFRLHSDTDFKAFKAAWDNDLSNKEFAATLDDDDVALDDETEE